METECKCKIWGKRDKGINHIVVNGETKYNVPEEWMPVLLAYLTLVLQKTKEENLVKRGLKP